MEAGCLAGVDGHLGAGVESMGDTLRRALLSLEASYHPLFSSLVEDQTKAFKIILQPTGHTKDCIQLGCPLARTAINKDTSGKPPPRLPGGRDHTSDIPACSPPFSYSGFSDHWPENCMNSQLALLKILLYADRLLSNRWVGFPRFWTFTNRIISCKLCDLNFSSNELCAL